VETSGENRIVVVPGANGAYDTSELLRGIEALSGAKLCLFQLEIPLETVHRGLLAARERGCVTILDPAPAQILSTDLLATVDILTPNLSELSILSQTPLDDETPLNKVESAAGRLLSMGVGKVLAKLGARGALLVDESGVSFAQALPVQATDSTAAGDCFNGALAAALARGESALEATQFACAAAALSVTREGAQSSIPSLEEVIRFMASPLRQPRGA
jgi:ribokinase